MPVFIGGAASIGHTHLAGNDWHGGSPMDRSNEPPIDDWSEEMQKLKLSVATSTFSILLGVGFFCTCLYLACCRQKQQRKIRGKAYWDQEDPNVTYGISTAHGLDPNGLSINPYMMSPYVQSQLFGKEGGGPVVLGLEGENGFYHFPMENKTRVDDGVKTDEKSDGVKVKDGVGAGLDVVEMETDKVKSEPYKHCLPRMKEWEPPTQAREASPPSYLESGHENPAYTSTENEKRYGDKLEKLPHKQPETEILRKLQDLGTEFGVGENIEKVNYAQIHASPYNPEFTPDPKGPVEDGKVGNDANPK